MKLRRALALAAATAVIAPAAVLAVPAAFAVTTDGTAAAEATGSPSPSDSGSPATEPSPSASAEETGEESGTPGPGETSESTGPAPGEAVGATPSDSASASSSASASPSESEDPEEPAECAKSDLDISVNGLPGRIARGSGWHTFKMNVYNSSKSAVKEIDYFAGASSDKAGNDLFRSKQVSLQALDPETDKWVELSEDGRAVGYVGQSDEIPAGYEVDIPLRINVKPTAPVGAGFTLGAGLYVGDKDCMGVSDVAYKFKIVESGGSGSTPQTGGSAPVPSTKPADNPTGKVSGSLAETGSSSALPVFATAGGAAVVLGAGAMFIVRRRRNGDAGV
ncbi:LAETG motif-containing sortase-dependent surface protein [Streptomyces sp. NBC_01363]|uniref:LAETG motif-containing sortase-dependent surface protein n=1 Tax=Streptomyces sp. NBC_01363 TaxID=2903840 RepID=UPI00224C8F20|nr:LAETG motif-containing sortase-dependent surface protein [Streptomyces sp. NBC_01363]MCX4730061.1 LPXTG cell wall anchor domain-containing protein [Streptomyces sp. NBC_01363]